MKVEVKDYEDITLDQKRQWRHRKISWFLVITWPSGEVELHCDDYDPEDVSFVRDLKRVGEAITRAYEEGAKNAGK